MKTNMNIGDRFVEELNLYQAANTDDKTLKDNFIIRINEFDTIVNTLLRTQANDSLQHELILGARGSGKSTLLRRIEIELKENRELIKKFIPINFAEEQAGIFRLADLWYEILKELQPDIQLHDFSDFENNHIYTQYLYGVLNKTIKEKKKKVVLLLDNFDRIIESIKDDAKMLRAALINDNNIQIIAASTRISEHFWKHDKPFYDFFRHHKLKPLSLQEIDTLLKHWSKIMSLPVLANYTSTHRGNIEAIRILTDGLPRTLQFFIRILLSNDEKFDAKYIRLIMDKVTPIYQERLWSLTKAQQKIVLETAFFWKPVSTKELVNLCRMESKLIASYLKQLEQYGIIKKLKTEKRNNKYRIAERFFNMWLIATQGNPEQRRKAIYLTLFLEYWYSKDELKLLAKQHLDNLKSRQIGFEKASVLTKAISQSKHIGLYMRDELIESTMQLGEQSAYYLPKKAITILEQIIELQEEGKINEALKLAEKIENEEDGAKFYLMAVLFMNQDKYKEAEKYYLMAIEKGHASATNNLALIYMNQDKYKEAETYYLMALEKGHADAMYNLAFLYHNQDKYKEAETYYLMAIDKGHTGAMYNLAFIYHNQDKYKEAEKYYLMAVEKGDADAMYNLALLYKNQDKYKEAEKYYLMAVEKEGASAMYNLALLYKNQDKYKEAEKYYLMAIEKEDAGAMNNLALLYKNQDKYKEAEQYYLMAVEKGDTDAMYNLALLHEEQDKYKEAETYYLMAIEKGHVDAMYNLALLYHKQDKYKEAEKYYLMAIEKEDADAMYNLALLYKKQDKYKEAEKYYLMAVEKGHTSAMNNLAFYYFEHNKNSKKALELIQSIKSDDNNNKVIVFIIEIWNGIFNDVSNRMEAFIEKLPVEMLSDLMLLLLSLNQKNLVLSYFESDKYGKELQEKLSLLYFATLFLSNKIKNTALEIPEEVIPTVMDIVEEVNQKMKFYNA